MGAATSTENLPKLINAADSAVAVVHRLRRGGRKATAAALFKIYAAIHAMPEADRAKFVKRRGMSPSANASNPVQPVFASFWRATDLDPDERIAESEQISRYAAAIQFALLNKITPKGFLGFIKEHGGFDQTSRAYASFARDDEQTTSRLMIEKKAFLEWLGTTDDRGLILCIAQSGKILREIPKPYLTIQRLVIGVIRQEKREVGKKANRLPKAKPHREAA